MNWEGKTVNGLSTLRLFTIAHLDVFSPPWSDNRVRVLYWGGARPQNSKKMSELASCEFTFSATQCQAGFGSCVSEMDTGSCVSFLLIKFIAA
jgi:hypothetical protein